MISRRAVWLVIMEFVDPREGSDIFSALTANVFVTSEGSKKPLLYRVNLRITVNISARRLEGFRSWLLEEFTLCVNSK